MKSMQKIAGAAASVGILLLLLSVSFDRAVYGNYRFFEKEYVKYQVQEDLPMEMEEIMKVTVHMMEYLRGEEPSMQITAVVGGESREFFNDQDLFHMEEVQTLFLGMYALGKVGLALMAAMAVGMLWMKTSWSLFFRQYQRTLLVTAIVLGVLGIGIVISFDRLFILFHHIVFDNDQWLFDPRTDLMIRMLPEGLFMDFALRILGWFVGLLAAVEGVFLLIKRRMEKEE